jgi:two-component system LytT family sensor kinase
MEDQKLRFWENWVVFGALLLFVIKSTQKLSNRIIADIEMVNGDYQAQGFDIFWNLYFPIASLALLVYLSWFVFHNFAYPRLKDKPQNPSSIALLLLSFLLCFAGIYIYHNYRLFWHLLLDFQSEVDLIIFSSWDRKIILVSNTILVLYLIFAYEACSVLFYIICQKLRNDGAMNSLIINFIFGLNTVFIVYILGKSGEMINISLKPSISPLVSILTLGVPLIFCQHLLYKTFKARVGTAGLMPTLFMALFLCLSATYIDRLIHKSYSYPWSATFTIQHIDLEKFAVIFLALLAASITISLFRFNIYKRNNKLERQVILKSAELDQLKMQVNPHFLFNALNTLYSVSLKENAETTAVGIQKLGDMMRFMLNENNQDYIPLSREIEQLENYIQIQRMRLDESQNIKISVNISHPEKDIFIAPMLLNPFVENAFKHGISFRNPSWIHITLSFDERTLYFKVHNSLHQVLDFDSERNNNGIGLQNVIKRLALIYPKKHKLEVEENGQEFFISLEIVYN